MSAKSGRDHRFEGEEAGKVGEQQFTPRSAEVRVFLRDRSVPSDEGARELVRAEKASQGVGA